MMLRPTGFAKVAGVPAVLVALIALVFLAPFAGALAPPDPANRDNTSEASPPNEENILDAYANLPLAFVPNAGQTHEPVRYYAQTDSARYSFAPGRVSLSFSSGPQTDTLHLVPLDARADSMPEPVRPSRTRVNYLLGSRRFTNLPTYREMAYRDLWPGIDLSFRGEGGRLKYEFRVAPGADPSQIRLAYEGSTGLSLGARGELVVPTSAGTLRDSRPQTYQQVRDERVAIESHYVLDEPNNAFGFEVGEAYDPSRPLVIDPGPEYSTFVGGSGNDIGIDIAVGADGSAYVTGGTHSDENFPVTPGAFDGSYNSDPNNAWLRDAFVVKLNPAGSALVYATYFGGSEAESGLGIAVDANGFAYVSGGTGSPDFPTTPGAFDESHNGFEDVFVIKLSQDGSALVYSTVIGGASNRGDFAPGIALDRSGNAFITGGTASPEFPTTTFALDRTHAGDFDAFVAKVNPTGSALLYSTLLGGIAFDAGARISVRVGIAHVTGNSESADFPTTPGSFDTSHNGGQDAFVVKLNAGGSALSYATYLGGSATDYGRGIAVGPGDSAYVTGATSSPNFPTTAGAFDQSYNRFEDGYVAKLNAAGSALSYSTFVGGGAKDRSNSVAVDTSGNAYVAGETASADFPTTPGAFDPSFNGGGQDAFVVALNGTGSGPLLSSTYLGSTGSDFARGIAIDGNANAYVAGRGGSADFPTTAGTFDASWNGGLDVFVTKLPRP